MEIKNETSKPGILLAANPDANDTVCIHRDRFAELVRKETALEILRKAYRELETYQLDEMLPILLGCKKIEGDAE